ncbi:MAG: DciA family protein [Comamonas sp.]
MPARRHYSITLEQAAQSSPALSNLVEQARAANARLKTIESLLPPGLAPHIQAGPLEGDTWLLLVKNSAAASKLRHLLPALEAHLRTKGWNVARIQIKILNASPWQSPL